MRKTDVWKFGKKTIAAIIVFAMVFSVFVGIAQNTSAGNADKGIKSTVDVTGAPAPTIDGTIDAAEWADAVSVSLAKAGDADRATAYLKHDGTKLYVGFDVQDTTPEDGDSVRVVLDTNNDKSSAPQTDDFDLKIEKIAASLDERTGTGTGWSGTSSGTGWIANTGATATGWSAEFAINYAKLGITAGNAETIGLYLVGKDSTPNYWYSWPAAEYPADLLIDPSTWGDASSSDNWFRAEVGWLEGYTVDEAGVAVGNIQIWIYGGAEEKYYFTGSDEAGYYNFNTTVPTGILIGDYSLIAANETLLSEETLFPTIVKDTTTTLNITLIPQPPMESTGAVTFKDEFANLTIDFLFTSSMVLLFADANEDGYVSDTEAGLMEDLFAADVPEPAADEPIPDFFIDDTQYLYVSGTWNLIVDVPTGNVTQVAIITWTMKANYTNPDVNVSGLEHIINMTETFDTETEVSSKMFILPQEWRMDVYDASTTNVTITGWTTIAVDPQIDLDPTDDIINETVSITVVKDVEAPATIAGFAAVPGLTSATLTWTAAPEPDFKEYRIYKSTSAITDVTATGVTLIETITVRTTTSYVAEALHGNWYFAIVAVDALGSVGILNATGPILMNQDPIADFTILPVAPYYTGTELTFTSTSTDPDDDTLTYFWDFDDDTNSTEANPVKSYTAPGEYTVTLNVTDAYSAVDSKTLTITLIIPNEPPVANFTISTGPYYRGTVITFNASTTTDPDVGDVLNYTWNISGVIKYGLAVTNTFTALGTFNVTLTVRDSYDETDTITKQITIVNQAPTASFTASKTEVEVGVEITFDAAGSSDPDGTLDTLTYTWDFGDDTTDTGATVTHKYEKAGTYTVTLTVNDGTVTDTETKSITVKEKPTDIWIYAAVIIIILIIVGAVAAVVMKKKKKPEAVPETEE